MTGWEVIGQPECPILRRRTLLAGRAGKLLLHHFFAESRDRDPHDHPAAFLTIVLWGGYDDVQPDGTVDRLRAGSIRFRRARHTHTTYAGPKGAITLVVMGPKTKPWGFLRDGRYWPWRIYERRFGHGFRCSD